MTLLTSLEAYYQFDGNGRDASGNGRDLTFNGVEAYDTGKIGSGYDLDGLEANNAVRGSDDPVLSFDGGGASYTIACWFNPTTLSGGARVSNTLVEKWNSGTSRGWSLAVGTAGEVAFVHATAITLSTATGLITTGAGFFHIVVISDGVDIKIYVNGAEEATIAFAANTLETNVLRIGDNSGVDSAVDGVIDEMALWDRALSLGELGELYNGSVGLELRTPVFKGPNLQSYFKFNDDGLDASGLSRDLTYTGSETYAAGRFGNGYDLNGSTADFAEGSTSTDLDFDGLTAEYAISLWVRLDDATPVAPGDILVEKFTGPGGPGWTLEVNPAGGFGIYNGVASLITGSALATTGWQHVVVNSDGVNRKIYINGVEEATAAMTAGTASTNPLRIGERDGAQNMPLDGTLDEMALWDRALTLDEIASLYNGGAAHEIQPAPLPSIPYVQMQVVHNHRQLRHKSKAYFFNGALFHTGLEPPPPTPGARPHMHVMVVHSRRVRHRSRALFIRPLIPPIPPLAIIPPLMAVHSRRVRHRSRAIFIRPHLIDWGRRATRLRGLYRVFNDAEYRFFRTLGSPPLDSDSPFATNATLPHEPVDTYADGEWYLSLKYFNGAILSDFLPVGPNGETWVRLSIAATLEIGAPPQPPFTVTLQLRAGGVVRVVATYDEALALRADDFVISATFDGSAPPEDPGAPIAEVTVVPSGFAFLSYDLPAQAHATPVRVRVQMRRTDLGPLDVWSEGSTIFDATADALGPTAPAGGAAWRGSLPAEE